MYNNICSVIFKSFMVHIKMQDNSSCVLLVNLRTSVRDGVFLRIFKQAGRLKTYNTTFWKGAVSGLKTLHLALVFRFENTCVMNPWDPSIYTVTPAANILARCVAAGTMTQEELNAVPQESEVFSSSLLEVDQLNRIKQDLDQTTLDLELLKLESDGADVTHSHYLSQRSASLQQFTSHLQDVLREQTVLRERLTKPLCQQNLPIQADLHKYVVELMGMVVEYIQNLNVYIEMVKAIPTTEDSLSTLNNASTQLLAQVTEVENLYKQVLKRLSQPHVNNTDVSVDKAY